MTWTELENEVVNLEYAEKLLFVYDDFLDECPTEQELKQEGNKDVELKALIYSKRTETYKSVLRSAFSLIRGVRENLNTAVDKMIAEAKEAKKEKGVSA